MDATELAVETTKQLITLSSAIVTIIFTFFKNFREEISRNRTTLNLSIGSHFASITFGIWTLMAVTGNVALRISVDIDIYNFSITLPASLQIFCFLGGMLFMLITFLRT